jgi:hypothetical protein
MFKFGRNQSKSAEVRLVRYEKSSLRGCFFALMGCNWRRRDKKRCGWRFALSVAMRLRCLPPLPGPLPRWGEGVTVEDWPAVGVARRSATEGGAVCHGEAEAVRCGGLGKQSSDLNRDIYVYVYSPTSLVTPFADLPCI